MKRLARVDAIHDPRINSGRGRLLMDQVSQITPSRRAGIIVDPSDWPCCTFPGCWQIPAQTAVTLQGSLASSGPRVASWPVVTKAAIVSRIAAAEIPADLVDALADDLNRFLGILRNAIHKAL